MKVETAVEQTLETRNQRRLFLNSKFQTKSVESPFTIGSYVPFSIFHHLSSVLSPFHGKWNSTIIFHLLIIDICLSWASLVVSNSNPMDVALSRPAVVIDNGTGYTKMGFAGNIEPCFIIPTVVAVNESFTNHSRSSTMGNWLAQNSAGVMADLDFFIGEEALSRSRSSGTYNLSYPIQHGQVQNWDSMERFWQQCIFNYLQCDPEDHYFLLTESPLNVPENREYAGEIMFETFNVPGLYIATEPVLALAAGYTTSKCEMTGVVVDVGEGATHIVPVAEGYVIGGSIKSIPIAGKDVTLFIQQLLRERGEHIPSEDSFEVARKVKEMYCYTSTDILKEFGKHDREPSKYIKQWTGIKPKTGAPYSCDIGYERFLGPEVFFNPEIYSSDFTTPLPDVIDKCIQSSPIDTRRALYKNIVLSGGSTMFKDFHKRLQRELKKIVDARMAESDARHGGDVKSQPVEVNVVGHTIQSFAVWFGGSALASTPEFYSTVHLMSLQWMHPPKTPDQKTIVIWLAIQKKNMMSTAQASAVQIPYSKGCIDVEIRRDALTPNVH